MLGVDIALEALGHSRGLTYPEVGAMDPGARAAPLVAWLWPVLPAPDPDAPLPPTPLPLPVFDIVAEPASS